MVVRFRLKMVDRAGICPLFAAIFFVSGLGILFHVLYFEHQENDRSTADVDKVMFSVDHRVADDATVYLARERMKNTHRRVSEKCAEDEDCAVRLFCASGECVAKVEIGKACISNASCMSGCCVSFGVESYCISDVRCDEARVLGVTQTEFETETEEFWWYNRDKPQDLGKKRPNIPITPKDFLSVIYSEPTHSCANRKCSFDGRFVCQCDSLCLEKGDCCDDSCEKCSVCPDGVDPPRLTPRPSNAGAPGPGCRGRCNNARSYNRFATCQCDDNCWRSGDCCEDVCSICDVCTESRTPFPTVNPTLPTPIPSPEPSLDPTTMPTPEPSSNATLMPTSDLTPPTPMPTSEPSSNPTLMPTSEPSSNPTLMPTSEPSSNPTLMPTSDPTPPTPTPTYEPSSNPTFKPTPEPSSNPTLKPTSEPSSLTPTSELSSNPTLMPTSDPSSPTPIPTKEPTASPTPTTPLRTDDPTRAPNTSSTRFDPQLAEPTVQPTPPTSVPTDDPTRVPTPSPTKFDPRRSCNGRCEYSYNPRASCQCDNVCVRKGDCCDDVCHLCRVCESESPYSASDQTPPTPLPTSEPTKNPTLTTPNPTRDAIENRERRCGHSELDARGKCKPLCRTNRDCYFGELCYEVYPNHCNRRSNSRYVTHRPTPYPTAEPTEPTFMSGRLDYPYYSSDVNLSAETRCGQSEVDARENCKQVCRTNEDCSEDDESCFRVYPNYCNAMSRTIMRCGKSKAHASESCGRPCRYVSECAFGESCFTIQIDKHRCEEE